MNVKRRSLGDDRSGLADDGLREAVCMGQSGFRSGK